MPTAPLTQRDLQEALRPYRPFDQRRETEFRRLALMLDELGVWTITSTTTPQLSVRYDASNRLDISVSSAGAVTFDAVGSGSTFDFLDRVLVTDTTAPQWRVRYDASNYLQVSVSSAGALTYDAVGASAGHTFSDPVTCSSTLHVTDNLSLFAAGSFGAGVDVVFVGNATTVPTTNPSGGGILYVTGGALTYRGSSGSVTTIAPA